MKINDIDINDKDNFFKCSLLLGDAKTVLKSIPDKTFHMSVTSPPYWDQRNYNVQGQLGQESTPEEYVDKLVEICREVKRTLRDDGTFWLNIGDGYCKKNIKSSNLKQKDLIGIPWMVAFALRKDGWYLRSDVIWKKTNPMPESTKSRPSKSYEHLFLLTKSEKYYYDAQAIAEPQKKISVKRAFSKNSVDKRKDYKNNNYAISGQSQAKTYEKLRNIINNLEEGESVTCNKRDVWELATADNNIKHFAMYPPELIKPCILAGSSLRGCCSKCQSPWVRQEGTSNFLQSCDCKEPERKPCIILDPFNGSGTTGVVCKGLNKKYVGIDISEEYLTYTKEVLIDANDSIEVESVEDLIGL